MTSEITDILSPGQLDPLLERRRLVATESVRRLFDISRTCLHRWRRDGKLNFPAPACRIRERDYWRVADLVSFLETQERKHADPDPLLKTVRRVRGEYGDHKKILATHTAD